MWDVIVGSLLQNSTGFLVLLVLGGVSICSWAWIFASNWRFWDASRGNRIFERRLQALANLPRETSKLHHSKFLQDASKSTAPLATVYVAGMRELSKLHHMAHAKSERRAECLMREMECAIATEVQRLRRGMGFLALTASASPYVGLLGTVLGVMRAFTSIGRSGEVSLSVVAPGISEALAATAAGLFTAVPSLVAYNVYQGMLHRHQETMQNFVLRALNRIERGN